VVVVEISGNGEEILSCTTLTCGANRAMGELHVDRRLRFETMTVAFDIIEMANNIQAALDRAADSCPRRIRNPEAVACKRVEILDGRCVE
jgi:hypothetical protein